MVKYAPRKVYIRESGGYVEYPTRSSAVAGNPTRPIWTSCLSPFKAVCLKS